MKKKRLGSGCWGSVIVLACAGTANAQSQLSSNEQVAQAFGQTGGPVPQIVPQADGSTRIEWKGGVTADAYVNSISSANGSTNTPLTSGNFGKVVMQSDLRGIGPGGDVSQFVIGATSSNDRSVLSLYPNQINNMQLGRAGPGYQLMLGDIAPNFSTLSTALAARGLLGQRQFGATSVTGYTGVVAESWEALGGLVPRSALLRDVSGLKLEHAVTPGLKVYATGQVGADRSDSVTAPAVIGTLQPAAIRSGTGGFQYLQGPWQLSGEMAMSNFEQTGQQTRNGSAMVLDGTWKGTSLSLRAGHHELSAGFVTLSTAAQPGVTETYTGADWTAAPWLTVGSELRNTRNSTVATEVAPTAQTNTDSGTLRATINFGTRAPGWTANLQQTGSRGVDPLAERTRNGQTSAGVNYASPTWTGGFNYSLAQVRSAAGPASDADTESYQLMLGRALLGPALANAPPSWSANLNFSAGQQHQHLLIGNDTITTNYSLGFTGQRAVWGSLNLVFTGGQITQPTGAPALRQRGLQFEAAHPFNQRTAIKLYTRDTQRNIGDPTSGATERVTGVQLSYKL